MACGEEGIWKRAHRTPRRALFTPHCATGGPGRQTLVGGCRTTIGTYVGSGKKLEIVDNYNDPNHAHRILVNSWIGTSEFRVMNVDSEDEMVEIQINNKDDARAIGALSSLCARPRAPEAEVEVPRLRCEPVRGGARSGKARAKTASHRHLGGETGRTLKSRSSPSELCASALPILVASPYCCDPISSPATSLGTGNERGGVRESHRQIGYREQLVAYRQANADQEFGAPSLRDNRHV